MNALKAKFGKFAVSAEKMAKLVGGSDDDALPPGNWTCWDKEGKPVEVPASLSEMIEQAENGGLDGCSN